MRYAANLYGRKEENVIIGKKLKWKFYFTYDVYFLTYVNENFYTFYEWILNNNPIKLVHDCHLKFYMGVMCNIWIRVLWKIRSGSGNHVL